MKMFQLCFVIIFAMLGGTLPAIAQNSDKHCLDKVWERTNPTKQEKEFDLKNDRSITEFLRYSCENNVSASEVNRFLIAVQNAVNNSAKEDFASLLHYPFSLYPEDSFTEITQGLINIENEVRAIEYHDVIVNDNFKLLLSCASIDRFSASGPFGILLARGYLRIEQDKNTSLKLAKVGTFGVREKEWYLQNCK